LLCGLIAGNCPPDFVLAAVLGVYRAATETMLADEELYRRFADL
jgi:hypothetical protein